MRPILLAAVAPLALAACVSDGEPASTAQNFICDRSDSVGIVFADEKAMLSFAGSTATLDQQPTGSGFRYTGAGHEIRGKGYEFTWTKPDGATRSCREEKWAMQQPQIQPPVPSLAGSKWRLVYFQSSDDAIGTKIPPSVERYNMEFMADGNVALQLDCNRARATWEATNATSRGGSLALSGGPMTRAMCQPGALDTQIARDLVRVRSYTFDGNRLGLALEADAGIYLWERQD
ncbi:MAG: META domain-containing protein [Sphingomonadaceae bacterium]|nr:META domain-containing protein [Sphingomonadaceae bacterium]